MRSRLGIYLGFAATGVGTATPGALLPVLLRHWRLSDASAGLLLFCFFLASTAGALLSKGRMNRSVARGAFFAALGAIWLASASRGWGFAAMAVYGFGLGMAMTSTSLLVSRRFPAERRLEMMRLNLLWAAGACAGPWLILGGRTLHAMSSTARPVVVLLGVAAFFAAWSLWMWVAEQREEFATAAVLTSTMSGNPVTQNGARVGVFAVPLSLMILVFCATGTENATGGWLAAYAQRLGATADTTIGAATAFWAGLLGSRLVHSMRAMERLSERVVLPATVALMAMGLALLVAWPGGAASVGAAFAVGFGAGPVYPLLLAMVLRRRESRGIFVLAGAGASAVPLMTGAVSGWLHSLSAGLCVPLAAAGLMTVLSLRMSMAGMSQPSQPPQEMLAG
jgi:fucose permease